MAGADQNSDEQILSPKIISPAALGVVVLLLFNYFTDQTYSHNPVLVLGFAGVVAVFAFSHFVPAFKFGHKHFFYLYAYHWLLCFMMIFIVPTLSYYLYLWVMFMYLAEYFYQIRGTILSAGALALTMVLGTLYQDGGISADVLRRMIPEFAVLIVVNQVLTHFVFGNRQNRKELAKKIVKAEYEHGRLVALINSMSDAVIATDEKGRILTYNAAALDLLDTNATLSDMNIDDVLQLIDSVGRPVAAMQIAAETTYLQHRADLSIPLSKDDKLDLDVTVSRIARSTLLAKQQGFTFLLRDITKQKSLDEERDLFISEVSHELRTPITIAEGEMSMAMLLTDKQKPVIADIKESVERAHDQVVFLADMVNDLSALSRAQRDDAEMEIERFEVIDVLKELEQTYRPQAEKKGLYLKMELAPATPALITCRLYFKEIMQNFITNAIKYTSKGGVTISGQAVDREHVIVTVTDTGAGISKSDQAKVYQKFWRSEDPYTRSTGGTGLGLFITSKLAHRLGAELRLMSKLKEGSSFSLILPVKAGKDVDKGNVIKNEITHLFD